ncbi:hypothetical protein ABK040_007362 [Willaertia magna]
MSSLTETTIVKNMNELLTTTETTTTPTTTSTSTTQSITNNNNNETSKITDIFKYYLNSNDSDDSVNNEKVVCSKNCKIFLQHFIQQVNNLKIRNENNLQFLENSFLSLKKNITEENYSIFGISLNEWIKLIILKDTYKNIDISLNELLEIFFSCYPNLVYGDYYNTNLEYCHFEIAEKLIGVLITEIDKLTTIVNHENDKKEEVEKLTTDSDVGNMSQNNLQNNLCEFNLLNNLCEKNEIVKNSVTIIVNVVYCLNYWINNVLICDNLKHLQKAKNFIVISLQQLINHTIISKIVTDNTLQNLLNTLQNYNNNNNNQTYPLAYQSWKEFLETKKTKNNQNEINENQEINEEDNEENEESGDEGDENGDNEEEERPINILEIKDIIYPTDFTQEEINKSKLPNLEFTNEIQNEIDYLLLWSPLEIAKQLTILEMKNFLNCHSFDFYRTLNSENTIITRNISGITPMIDHFNLLGNYLVFKILETKMDINKRVRIVNFFIDILDNLIDLQNYQTFMALFSAFNNLQIIKLEKTFEKIDFEKLEFLQFCNELCSVTKKFARLKEHLIESILEFENLNLPYYGIPYIGIYLGDISAIETCHQDVITTITVENCEESYCCKLFNFEKKKLITKILREVQTFQQSAKQYNSFEEIPAIQYILSTDNLQKQLPKVEGGGNTMDEFRKIFKEMAKDVFE